MQMCKLLGVDTFHFCKNDFTLSPTRFVAHYRLHFTNLFLNVYSSHTFHASEDVDWVSFVVPAADILNGVAYRFDTFNLGAGMATKVELFDPNMNLLASWIGYDRRGVSAVWKPSASGLYYLRISSPDSSYAAYCDARYDLLIFPLRGQAFLPIVGAGD